MYPESTDLDRYLADLPELQFRSKQIQEFSNHLFKDSDNDIFIINKAFRFVCNDISHSWDIRAHKVTRTATDVLRYGHGICYAKANLLASLLRSARIPTGFCYQKLCLFDETPIQYCIHALNAVYISKYHKWLRIDARGNNDNIKADFCPPAEKLAFNPNSNKGETNFPIIYTNPCYETMHVLEESSDALMMYLHHLPQDITSATINYRDTD